MEDWVVTSHTDSSENGGDTSHSTPSVSDIIDDDLPGNDGRFRVGQHSRARGSSSLATDRASSARSSLVHVSTAVSTDSGSQVWSYTPSSHWKSGSTPSISASEASNHSRDSVPQNSRTLQTKPSASPPRHISRQSSISSRSTSDADENSSCSLESGLEQQTSGTPATSNASLADDNVSVNLDLEVAHRIEVLPVHEALQGLFLHTDDNQSLSNLSIDSTDFLKDLQIFKYGDSVDNNSLWPAGTHDYNPATGRSIIGLLPGPIRTGYRSTVRVHKTIHAKRRQETTYAITTNGDGELALLSGGTCVQRRGLDEIDSLHIAGWKSTPENSQNERTSECHDSDVDLWRQTSQQSDIWGAIDCTSFSVETLSSDFFPGFANLHLNLCSVERFAYELIAPDGFLNNIEYNISVSLGFGPLVPYYVCAFVPNNKEHLRTYRKLPGEEGLQVEESLPIAIDLFSPYREAEDIDAWLDAVIDDEGHLQGYVDLMQRKKKGSPSVQILMCLVSWYLSSKDNPLKQADSIFRTALKLLMTMTLLTLVPKINDIPPSLSQHLSPRPAPENTKLSPVAPKLLTRQIKSSIHHLQRKLLEVLFCHLTCDMKLAAEVKVAVALLIAFVMELAQKAGREFAKFASKINAAVQVEPEDVVQYEARMETHIFNRLRASFCSTNGHLGQLSDRLRSLGSIAKGKGRHTSDQDCQYVQAILNTVL